MASHQLAKFGDHRHCDSGDIMILVCHMILQDHVIKWSFEFTGRIPSRYVTILPSLVAMGTVLVKIKLLLFGTGSFRTT